MPKSPTLYRLAAHRQYDSIPDRVHSHPEDLFWTDRYGSTALHILCQARDVDRRLLQAVAAILARAPEQVAWGNAATWTPLHFSVEKRWSGDEDVDLSLQLIQACPHAVSVATRNGFKTRTPFHLACEADADYCVLRAMLHINPRLATEPLSKVPDPYTHSENPLQLIWQHHAAHPRRTEQKMALLLQAAYLQSVHRTMTPSLLLHAVTTVRCPREYVELLLHRYPGVVAQPDANGTTPLHTALLESSLTHHYHQLHYRQYILQRFLEAAPILASIPYPSPPKTQQYLSSLEPRLPLHVAVRTAGLSWHKGGVRELVQAYPEALHRIDPATGWAPFVAAALMDPMHPWYPAMMHNTYSPTSTTTLDTTYELMRAAPDMVETLRSHVNDDDNRWCVAPTTMQSHHTEPALGQFTVLSLAEQHDTDWIAVS
jgi:ankyrin repeat protein